MLEVGVEVGKYQYSKTIMYDKKQIVTFNKVKVHACIRKIDNENKYPATNRG